MWDPSFQELEPNFVMNFFQLKFFVVVVVVFPLSLEDVLHQLCYQRLDYSSLAD